MPANDRGAGVTGQDEAITTEAAGFGHDVHRAARLALAAIVIGLAIWVARSFLISLAWAILIAIATWPLYKRFKKLTSNRMWKPIAPLLFTLLASLLLLVPLGMVTVRIAREARDALSWLEEAQKKGVAAPPWLENIPVLGERIEPWWQAHLSSPEKARELLSGADAGTLAAISKSVGFQVVDHVVHAVITFITLFLLYLDGAQMADRITTLSERLFGEAGRRLTKYLATAVRGVVNGIVLNAVLVGSVITVGYWVAGVPYPLHFGALTIGLAMIPLGAWLAMASASMFLFLQGGSPWHAAALFGFGAACMVVSDNVTQPALVGGSAELPFLAVLIGILGGLEAFGLIGLFLGPVSMAALLFVLREWIETPRAAERRKNKKSTAGQTDSGTRLAKEDLLEAIIGGMYLWVVLKIAVCIAVVYAALIFVPMIPDALRSHGILTGPPRLRFWPTMLLRAIALLALLAYGALVWNSSEDASGGKAPGRQSRNGAVVIAMIVIVADAVWDVTRRMMRRIRS